MGQYQVFWILESLQDNLNWQYVTYGNERVQMTYPS